MFLRNPLSYNDLSVKALAYLLLFLFGAGSVLGYQYFRVQQEPAFVPGQLAGKLDPPKQAVPAILSESFGDVEQILRENEDFSKATPGGVIRQGEAITTKGKSSAAVSVSGDFSLQVGEWGEVSFVSLVPASYLVWQKSGTVAYSIPQGKPTVSVRVLHSLLELSPGNASVGISDGRIIAAVTTGSAKIGIVDTDNNTHVYTVAEGERAVISDELRTVTVR